jgi:hypothetical protein
MSKPSSWNNKDVSVENAVLPVRGHFHFSCEALPDERMSSKLNEQLQVKYMNII